MPKKIEHGVIVKERLSGRCIINMWTGKKYGQEYNILSIKQILHILDISMSSSNAVYRISKC
jgi:hypothetical protein